MSRKHRKKQNNNTELATKQFNNEIYGIFTIAIGLILLVSIQGNSVGRVGEFIKFILMGLFASTIAFLPYLMILYGVFIFINKSLLKEKKTILFYTLVFISITIFKSLRTIDVVNNIVASNTSEWLQEIFILGTKGIGGGVVGISITKSLVNLFGITITYIIVFTLLLISLLLHTKISLLSIIVKLKNEFIIIICTIKSKLLNFIFVPVKNNNEKSKKKDVKTSSSKTLEENVHIGKDNVIDEKIKILDFTTIDSDQPLNIEKESEDNSNKINHENIDENIGQSANSSIMITI